MTPQEQKFVKDCEWTLSVISSFCPGWPAGAKLVMIDALNAQIKLIKQEPATTAVPRDDRLGFVLGLTFSDLMHLQNGGTLKMDLKDGIATDTHITIFLGGTHEHMAEGLKNHPDADAKFINTHGEHSN